MKKMMRMLCRYLLPPLVIMSAGMISEDQESENHVLKKIISGIAEAAGGEEIMLNMKNIRFHAGMETYTVLADGRMKVTSSLGEPVIFEAVSVDEGMVRRNTMNHIEEIGGIERDRWFCLARIFGGAFTMKNFSGLSYEGMKSYGPERHHLIATRVGSLDVLFHVDTSSFRVTRMVMKGKSDAGESWEQCVEFSGNQTIGGVVLPTLMYVAQVGVQGTGGFYTRQIGNVDLNREVDEDSFGVLRIHAGESRAEPGRLTGNVLFPMFREDKFVIIVTNWTREDIKKSGFSGGDRLAFSAGGPRIESKLYMNENDVDDPMVYKPGNSLFTCNPARFPMFYIQFNELVPEDRFNELKSGFPIMATIEATKITKGD